MPPPMTACQASLFISALVAILAHGAEGNEFGDRLTSSPARPSRLAYSGPSGLAPNAYAEVDNGPDPHFIDLDVNVAQRDDPEFSDKPGKLRTFSVDVYELQSGGIGRRWRRIGWTYKVKSTTPFRAVALFLLLPLCVLVCRSLSVWAPEHRAPSVTIEVEHCSMMMTCLKRTRRMLMLCVLNKG